MSRSYRRNTEVNTTIQSMTASDNTYLPAGVMWGWRTLQDEEALKTTLELTNGKKTEPKQVMVFMTDGANTTELKKVFKELAGKLNFSRLAMKRREF